MLGEHERSLKSLVEESQAHVSGYYYYCYYLFIFLRLFRAPEIHWGFENRPQSRVFLKTLAYRFCVHGRNTEFFEYDDVIHHTGHAQ